MARQSRAWRVGWWLGLMALDARALVAQPLVGSARLSWVRGTGAERCPDASEMEARVREATGRDVFARPPAQSIEVLITRDASMWTAVVRAYDPLGVARGTRTLTAQGNDCAPIASLAAVAVALSIDPEARTPPPVAPVAPVAPTTLVVPLPNSALAPPAPLAVQTVDPPRTRGGLLLRGFVTTGVLPDAAAGLSLGVEPWVLGRLRWELEAMWWPQSSSQGYPARFGLTALGVRGCVDLTRATRWTLATCGDVHAGALHAVVYERTPVDPGVAPWVSLGLGARLRWRPVGRWVIELDAALWANTLRYNFTVEGAAASVFEQPFFAAIGRAGVGLEW